MIRFPADTLRYLTVRESARVQSFPDDYEFPGARSRVMGVIGNAVAVAVAETIGRSLIEHCELAPQLTVIGRRLPSRADGPTLRKLSQAAK